MKGKNIILIGVPTVHTVNQILRKLDKAFLGPKASSKAWPITGMGVFNHIEATVRKPRLQRVEAGYLLVHLIATIINNDVKRAMFGGDILQKYSVGLIADFNSKPWHLKRFAGRINIKKGQPTLRPEIVLPHLDGAALPDANF
jgi:hypothetical protein